MNGHTYPTNLFYGVTSELSTSPIFPSLKETRRPTFFIGYTIGYIFRFSRGGPLNVSVHNSLSLPPNKYDTGTNFGYVFRGVERRRARVSLIREGRL